jgi:hypothetical protein
MIRKALRRTLRTGAALAATVFSLASIQGQQASPATRLITDAVNNSDRVALSGSMRKDLGTAADLGAANPSLSAHVTLLLDRSANRQAALDQYLSAVQNTQSTQYHQWLTPQQYGARFGASADDVQALTAWLQSQGFTIERSSAAANSISFAGTLGQVQTAFSTTIHSVSVNGEKHLANVTEPQLPRALAPAVKGLLGLDDFHPRPNVVQGAPAKFNLDTHRIEPDLTLFDSAGTPALYVAPSDAATIYDVPNSALNTAHQGTSYDGTGVTVGVVGESNVDMTPVTNYRVAFLGETSSTANLPTVIIDGTDPGINGAEVETFLDLEVLGGIAPKAKIIYYTSNDTDISSGLFDAMERAINDNQVSILSISYGECEATVGTATNQFINELFEQAAAQGITVTVSSGDSGAAGCDSSAATSAANGLAVNGLSSTPYDIAVGGTDYDVLGTSFTTYVNTSGSGNPPYYGTALTYIPEEPWNDSTSTNGALANNVALLLDGDTDVIAGGGGMSSIYAKPAFQSSLTPVDGARDVPDVSFLAGNGLYGAVWVICESNAIQGPDCATTNGAFTSATNFSGVGGTSAATPAFAGMLALAVQATGSRLGQANNVLYKLAADKYSTVFHDVTTGNNSVVCAPASSGCGPNGFTTGYNSTTGYDLASGLGSVDAAAMLANWKSAVGTSSTSTLQIDGSTSPVSVTHGTSLNFAVDVNPTTASGVAGLVTTATAAAGSPTQNGTPYTIPIKNGTGTGTYNGLPGGQYTVYASYGGNLSDAASLSNAITVNIAPEASSTLLSVNAYTAAATPLSSLTAIPYGSHIFGETSVYGTAEGYNNSAGAATGTMTYLDNGTSIGTAPITSGNLASFPELSSTSYPFAVGTHKLTATYPGDASYKANTSNVVDFTVVKGITTAVLSPTTATVSSTTTDNVEVEVFTSSLASFPTGTITLSVNGTTLATTSTLTGANEVGPGPAFSYAVLPVIGAQLATGANTITASYSGDSNYLASTGTTTITASPSSFQLKAPALSILAGSTTANTATLSVVPSGTFAGPVNLSCAVTSSPANATSPVTCTVPASILVPGTGIATGALTINSTAATSSGSYVVTIAGKDAATGTITATTTSTVTVTTPPGIVLSSSPVSFTAGSSTGNTSTLTVTPTGAFTGAVSLSCAVTTIPANAIDPVNCGLSASSVTISGTTPATSTLTLASTARPTVALGPAGDLMRGVGGTVVAFGLFFGLPTRRRRHLRLLPILAVVSLGSLGGCGGGSGTGGTGGGTSGTGGGSAPAPSGTSAGNYVVTITAAPAGAPVQTTTVNVTVN